MAEAKEKPKQKMSRTQKVLGFIGMAAFSIGLVLAIIYGVISRNDASVTLGLVILGIVVGFLNITRREMVLLLLTAVALIVVGKPSFSPLNDLVDGLGTSLNGIVSYLAVFMAPAAVITAVRAIWAVARPGD
ncbi:MAG: hypothetical protein PVJ61_06240 [Dehalococcoidia bacterium]|jgi:hypothetical protein